MPPSALAAAAIQASMAAGSPRSQACACTLPPCVVSVRAVSSSAACPRAQIDTAAPDPAKASAILRPMPLLPPATTTRQPRKSNGEAVVISWSAPEVGDAQTEEQCGDQEEH